MSTPGKQAAIAALATMIMDGGAPLRDALMTPADDYLDSFRAPRRDRQRTKFNPYSAKQKAQRAARKKQRSSK